MLAMLIGCGLRRGELLSLHVDSIQLREEHWVISDLASNRMRTADRQNPWAAERPPLGDLWGGIWRNRSNRLRMSQLEHYWCWGLVPHQFAAFMPPLT